MSLRRREAARLVGGVAAVLVLGLGFAAWRVHRGLAGRTGEVLEALSTAIGLPVEADEVAVAWWPPGIVVRGLQIPDRSPYGPGSLAHADEARLRLGMAALLRGEAIVRSVELDTPVVRLVRGLDGGWNVGGLGRDVGTPIATASPSVREETSPPAAGAAVRARNEIPASIPFRIASVRVHRGRVSLRDRAIPGMPEFEITSAAARARRQGEGYVFEIEGDALGGPGLNLRGNLRVPGDGSDAVMKVSAAGVPSRRLPEVMQLLRGTVPFGATLGGVVSIEIDGRFPAAWPPSPALLDVALDAREAELRMAGGFVEKRAGAPLELALALRATADRLLVRQATLTSGEARIALRAPDVVENAEQPPLRVSSVNLAAERLAEWVPLLADVAPRGNLSLDGTLAPGGDVTAAELRLSGSALEVAVAKTPVDLGSAALDLEVQPGGAYAVGLSVDEMRSGDLHAERLTAALDARPGRETGLRVEGARGGRAGAELSRVSVESLLSEEGAEVRRIEIEGLGGRLHGDGRVVRAADADALAIRFDPRWDGVDLDGLQRLLGMPLGIRGEIEGEAALEIRRENGETLVDTLRGVFAARLREGQIADLNLARTTVDNLGAIPGLRQAVERRAREEAPALLARTSDIEMLEVGGSVADGTVDVTAFRLVAPDYSVDTRGRVAFDGNFDLDGELVLGAHATAALASKSGILALLAPAGETIRIPVSIEGVYPELVSAPSQAFVSGALPHAAREQEASTATGFLRQFLGSLGTAPSGETRGETRAETRGGAPSQ